MLELSLHVLDLLRNAVEAGAGLIRVRVEEDTAADLLALQVRDDGKGMTPELARQALDPFVTSRTARHVGLGLPLLAQAARQCGGGLTIESEPGHGTIVRATFRRSHWDRAPLGDMPGVLLAAVLTGRDGHAKEIGSAGAEGEPGNGGVRELELEYVHRLDGREFRFDTAEVRQELDGVPLGHPKIRSWILQTLQEGEAELKDETH